MQVPVFRVMNESFRRFAASALPSATIAAWEHEGAGLPWPVVRALLLTLAVVGALFLYLTQENLFEAWMAYVSGFVAAIPALLKFFGVFGGRHAQE